MTTPAGMQLFHPDLFVPEVEAEGREPLLAALVEVLCRHGVAHHRGAVLESLLARERLGTTALGRGVAVPHSRSMMVERTTVLFARLKEGLDLGAPDGQPTRLVFLITAPYGASGAWYLPLLAAIARAAQDEAARARLLEVGEFSEFAALMQPFLKPDAAEAADL